MTWFILRTQILILQSDPSLSSVTLSTEEGFAVDLNALSYGFAIQKIDSRIASFEVRYVQRPIGSPEKVKDIEMVDCEELGGKVGYLKVFEGAVNIDGSVKLLCPIMPDELKVRGKFGDQNFDYV